LQFGLVSAAAGVGAIPHKSFAQAIQTMPSRRLALHNLHTDEKLEAVYWENGQYVADALQSINKVLRDFRTNDVHPMDPRLMDLLASLSATVESKKPFQIISGYRSPRTNAMLHGASEHSGVANKSLHMQGMATDIRLPDVELKHVHKAALALGGGGVGYYPKSDFVHVDVGRVRHWG
jgi:uncharacterized protein YcbK (DUF882 family)